MFYPGHPSGSSPSFLRDWFASENKCSNSGDVSGEGVGGLGGGGVEWGNGELDNIRETC
jgi:hypothetical protein